MTKPKQSQLVSFRFGTDVRAKLEAIKERDGIPISEQLRRALVLWIEQRDQLAAFMGGYQAPEPTSRQVTARKVGK